MQSSSHRIRLPLAARAGLMRPWLAIPRDRYPDVAWIPVATTGYPETACRTDTIRAIQAIYAPYPDS